MQYAEYLEPMPQRLIDLRSDTVTRPTPAMRRAMAEAEVGDDVYGEDPTVNRLEQRAAEIVGKEAALFVPSGTMGNTIAVKLHTRHGQEVICDDRSHVFNYELAMMAWFSGCIPRPIATEDGILNWRLIQPQIRPPSPHWAPTGLIVLENTHNMAGGTVYPLATFREICDRAHALGLKVHLDGARLFNAATFLQRPAHELAHGADTVMFCLSKGLGAPVGSILAGSHQAIAEARLCRKRLGGGMRQAGVLAAAGLVALEQMPARLDEDHRNAQLAASILADIPGVTIPHRVETNIVIFDISATGITGTELSARLKDHGVLINPIGRFRMRLVTHYDVSEADCRFAADSVRRVILAAKPHPPSSPSR